MDAARLSLAADYVDMYGEMGSKSNTMFFSDRPADLSSLLVQAATAVGAVPGTDGTAAATKLLGRGKDAGSAGDPPP